MPESTSTPSLPLTALDHSRASTRRVLVAGAICTTVAGVWALWLPTRPALMLTESDTRVASTESPPPPLDLAAFDTPVWTIAEPIKVAAAPPPPPPPPPLRLQLLGIVREGDAYKAVLYDPDSNKVRVVAAGEELQGRRVERIAADTVSIKTGALVQVLALKSTAVTP
jgi:hypothetical protein